MSEDAPEQDETTGSNDSGQTSGSSGSSEGGTEAIDDDRLPEDLQPSEDNPLARHPGQTGDKDDEIGADREGDPDTAPLTAEDADYSESGDSSDS